MKLPLREFFRPQAIFNIPPGIAPDSVGAWGIFGLAQNANNYAEQMSSVASAGTAITLIASGASQNANTAGNILSGFVSVNAGATGALTVTFPATSAMIAALGNTIAQDGSYSEPFHVINNSGQTITLAAGDSNATILGSATVAVGNVRKLLLRVLNSSNMTFTNVGTWTL
jgi:hypothetical protein